jgi:hypothetical protein
MTQDLRNFSAQPFLPDGMQPVYTNGSWNDPAEPCASLFWQ